METGENMEPSQAQYDAILMRLGKLEKQNRRLKRIGIVVIIGFLALGTTAWTSVQERSYSARTFTVVDRHGGPRGMWFAEGGATALLMGDIGGKSPVLLLGHDENNQPGIILSDAAGTSRAMLGFGDDKRTVNLWLKDERGKTIWQAIP